MSRPLASSSDPLGIGRSDRRSLHRAVTSIVLAKGRYDTSAPAILKRHWQGDVRAALILKAATAPMGTDDFPAVQASTILPQLAPASAATRLFAKCLSLSMSGVTTIRLQYPSVIPVPVFVAEMAPGPSVNLGFGSVVVGPSRKILILAALSSELQNASADGAAAIVGNVLSQAASKSIDAAAFSSAAETVIAPPGLLFGVTPIAPSATGSTTEKIASDVAALAGAIAAAGIDAETMVVVTSEKNATKLRLLAGPNFTNLVLGSLAVPDTDVIGVAPGGVAGGYDGTPTVEASKETVIHEEDALPGAIVASTPTRSLWQTDSIVLRVRARAAWAALPGAVQVVSPVAW